MKANVVPIGNSRGIRIPQTILEECKIKDEVIIEVADETITIRPVKHKPRKNWSRAFHNMRELGQDELIVEDSLDMESLKWEW